MSLENTEAPYKGPIFMLYICGKQSPTGQRRFIGPFGDLQKVKEYSLKFEGVDTQIMTLDNYLDDHIPGTTYNDHKWLLIYAKLPDADGEVICNLFLTLTRRKAIERLASTTKEELDKYSDYSIFKLEEPTDCE